MTQAIVNSETMATVDSYLIKPYAQHLVYDSRDGIWVARVEELEGCSAHGSSPEEAISKLQDTMKDWILDAIEDGVQIPLPKAQEELPSGKWVQRVPRHLHLRLTKLAKREDTSLNQFVLAVLSEAVGREDERASISAKAMRTAARTEHSMAALYGVVEPAKQQVSSVIHRGKPRLALGNEILFEEHLVTLLTPSPESKGVFRFKNGGIAISAEADNQVLAYQA